MMKQEGRRHAKIIKAARELGIDRCALRGIVDEIHDETAARYPAGDIGRASNEDIAVYIDYSGDINRLIEVLLKHRLLDAIPDEQGRLYVHDWHDHCERYVREKLRGKNQTFANGLPPYPKSAEAPKEETQPPAKRPRRPRTPASQAQNAQPLADPRNSLQTDAVSLVCATLPMPCTNPLPPSGGCGAGRDESVKQASPTVAFTDPGQSLPAAPKPVYAPYLTLRDIEPVEFEPEPDPAAEPEAHDYWRWRTLLLWMHKATFRCLGQSPKDHEWERVVDTVRQWYRDRTAPHPDEAMEVAAKVQRQVIEKDGVAPFSVTPFLNALTNRRLEIIGCA